MEVAIMRVLLLAAALRAAWQALHEWTRSEHTYTMTFPFTSTPPYRVRIALITDSDRHTLWSDVDGAEFVKSGDSVTVTQQITMS